ncbi:CAP domain-containing protein [Streptomyces sp. NPDC000410]|uniref:CAP domain-containing protein n=1 Tax=Streptomyces sp. NPDC000410 TaxID=3154254 RepID=UPI0033301406
MRKHRRKTHYRKIAVAVIAIGAVGVPSAAMAVCPDDPQGNSRGPRGNQEIVLEPGQLVGQGEQPLTGAPFDEVPLDDLMEIPVEGQGEAPVEAPAEDPGAPAQRPTAPKRTAPEATAPKATAPKPTAPKATAPKPTAPASTAPASGAVAKVVQLVNSERGKVGCSPLTVNAKLTKAAEAHSKDMAAHKNMSHTGSDGSNPGDRITRAGYQWSSYGENVAYGYETPESVMQAWMSSPGHKRNILDCSFKEIGVALAQPNNYWSQEFGTAR